MRRRRCEGVEVKEVRGLNQNVACTEAAVTTRQLPGPKGKPKTFHYCAKCAGYWDEQQQLLRSAGLIDAPPR